MARQAGAAGSSRPPWQPRSAVTVAEAPVLPVVALALSACLFPLAGHPPLIGFTAKFMKLGRGGCA